MPSLPALTLPDTREFADARPWLASWCAARPDRSSMENIAELARYAGCSKAHMHQVIREERHLSPVHARALVPHLALPPEQASHLLECLVLPSLPPKLARARREGVLRTMAIAQDLPWGTSSEMVLERCPEPAIRHALAGALSAFEGDRPARPRLLAAAVPPLSGDQIDAATDHNSCWNRLAPRLLATGPGATGHAAWAQQGALSFAAEALLRLSASERDLRARVATVDEAAFLALDEECRWLETELVRLCDDVELRLPDRALFLTVQRLTAAGPFPGGASMGMPWVPPTVRLQGVDVPPAGARGEQGAGDGADPAAPSPVGHTWFPTWLKIWRAWRHSANLPCSDEWLARETGLSRSTIYDLATGAIRFGSAHVWAFAQAMRLDEAGQLALEGMAMVAQPDDPRARARLIHGLRTLGIQQGNRNLANEAYFVAAKWYADVIHRLAELPGFQAVPGWICRALKGRADWRACQEALDALAALGMLRLDARGQVVALATTAEVVGPLDRVALHELHLGLLRHFQAELDTGDPDLTSRAYALALPEKAVGALTRILASFDQRCAAALMAAADRQQAGAPMTRVIVLSRQLFPVFRARPKPRPRTPGPPKP